MNEFSEQEYRVLKLASEKARLGGWRVDLDSGVSTWTSETARIHDMPTDYSPPTVSDAIQFYAPEFRGLVQEAFDQCVHNRKDFDLICRLQTPTGRKPWVRAIGTAETDDQGKVIAVQGAFQDISVMQEAYERAEEAERQRLKILESISDAFFALDRNWHFTYANQQTCIVLERSRDELIGKSIWELFPRAIGSEFERQYRWAISNHKTVRFEEYYSPLNKWFEVSAYPTPDGLTVYFRDVTQERAHKERLRLIEAALSRQNDVVIITEAEFIDAPEGPRIVYVNDAFERLTGYTKSEAIGQTPRLLQGLDTDEEQLERIRHALVRKKPIRCEVLNYTKSGEAYWLELDITPLLNEEHRCTHFVAVERNITDRKRRDSQLRQAQERFELISSATNDVIWDWDLVTDKIWWNDSVSSVFGYSPKDLEPGPESWVQRLHPYDREQVVSNINQVIEGGKQIWGSEYRFLKGDGQYANVIDRGFVIRDEEGKAIRMVGSMRDITDQMEMEQRLRESQKMEALGHLTGGVAHDFNNLLTVIMSNADMLKDLLDDSDARSMAEMTLAAAQRGAKLTSRLLAFARRQPLDPSPTDLNQLVEAMHPLIRNTLPESIDLEFIPASNLHVIEVDASELDNALLNLVVNARDAMPDGGKLTIETANAVLDLDYTSHHSGLTSGDYVMICITDTGSGMSSQTVNRVFEPFFTTKDIGKGSGLGLSMVFGFTKQSGGHIQVYSELDEGTSIKLYFPRLNSEHYSDYHPEVELAPQGGSEHVLIAEDDALVLQHLESQLQSLGYRVTAATNGPEALAELTNQEDIEVLITDIVMPGGMSGRELAEKALAQCPQLKILYTSGYSENAVMNNGRLDPGVELLSKPYTRQQLASKVQQVIKDSNT